jgi:hypothetical protein
MTVERLARLGIVVALLTLGAVVVSLFAGLQALVSHPVATIGSILIGGIMVWLIAKVALTAERRHTGWTRSITGPNGKWLFLLLIVLWIAAMTFLASMGLGALQVGALALVMLFVGFFLFMGFIWAVIGE